MERPRRRRKLPTLIIARNQQQRVPDIEDLH